jgi:hypothetical protein
VQRRSIAITPPTNWYTLENTAETIRLIAAEYVTIEFRLEPPPDVVRYQVTTISVGHATLEEAVQRRDKMDAFNPMKWSIEKRTFDSLTGKLKSVEVVE